MQRAFSKVLLALAREELDDIITDGIWRVDFREGMLVKNAQNAPTCV